MPSKSKNTSKELRFAQGLFGYTAYDAIPFFETIHFDKKEYDSARTKSSQSAEILDAIPLMRYRLYQYVIAIDHFRDELYLLENHFDGIKGDMQAIENIICSRDIPQFPFESAGSEISNLTDDEYLADSTSDAIWRTSNSNKIPVFLNLLCLAFI